MRNAPRKTTLTRTNVCKRSDVLHHNARQHAAYFMCEYCDPQDLYLQRYSSALTAMPVKVAQPMNTPQSVPFRDSWHNHALLTTESRHLSTFDTRNAFLDIAVAWSPRAY
eukprot:4116256-Amphidinium_carterae.1